MKKVYYSDKAHIIFTHSNEIKCINCKYGISYSEDLFLNKYGIETDIIIGEYSTRQFKNIVKHLKANHDFNFLDIIKMVAFCRKNSINYSRY